MEERLNHNNQTESLKIDDCTGDHRLRLSLYSGRIYSVNHQFLCFICSLRHTNAMHLCVICASCMRVCLMLSNTFVSSFTPVLRSYASSEIAAIATLPIYTSLCGTTTNAHDQMKTEMKRNWQKYKYMPSSACVAAVSVLVRIGHAIQREEVILMCNTRCQLSNSFETSNKYPQNFFFQMFYLRRYTIRKL